MNDINRIKYSNPASRHEAGGSNREMGSQTGPVCQNHSMGRWLVALLAIFIGVQLLSVFNVFQDQTFPSVNPYTWQAVFLVNENFPLFGHLTELNKDYVQLSNIYYTQVSQQATSSKEQPQVSLIKFGNEIYGPSDLMNIPKSQILHWEEMRSDSTVVRSIERFIEAANSAKK